VVPAPGRPAVALRFGLEVRLPALQPEQLALLERVVALHGHPQGERVVAPMTAATSPPPWPPVLEPSDPILPAEGAANEPPRRGRPAA
jgi:hypothetical protein